MAFTNPRLYKISNMYGTDETGYVLIFDNSEKAGSQTMNETLLLPYMNEIRKCIGYFSADLPFVGRSPALISWELTSQTSANVYMQCKFVDQKTANIYTLDTTGPIGYPTNGACFYPFIILSKDSSGSYDKVRQVNQLIFNADGSFQNGLVYTNNQIENTNQPYKLGSLTGFKAGTNPFFAMQMYTNDTVTFFGKYIEGTYDPIDDNDPNDGGGNSKPNGGGGDGDIGGDNNPDDGLPTISALDSGLLTAYNPTVAELQSLGKFLWSDSFDLNSFKKLFNDPFDTLLGLSIIPIKPTTGSVKNIMFGNLDSGVSAPVVSDQWVSKDMGSVILNEVWKGALDYSPSTSASIYLPYIGMRQLNINDVMGATIHLIYKFDVLTGTCIAQLYVNHSHMGNKDGGFSWNANQGLLYEFMGQCSVNIPLASQDFTNTIRSAVSAVGMVAGASASIATGNPVLGVATMTMASANLGMQANTPTVERSGHLSGSGSLLGYYQPFLVVTRPHQCKPKRYYALRGVPSQVYTDKLSSCTGFTQITANNNLHISGAEDSELAEIQNLLVSGVYFPDKKR